MRLLTEASHQDSSIEHFANPELPSHKAELKPLNVQKLTLNLNITPLYLRFKFSN